MLPKERIDQIKITLPLIVLSLPVFAHHNVVAENACPFETYIRVDNKCLDISEQGLNEIAKKLDNNAVPEINQEIKDVSQQLAELSAELAKFCLPQQSRTDSQAETLADICQY
ncbi:MAG: hypothetical protein AAFQ80_24095 [Cyanobacteria bacterium J06621_8]